MLLSFELTRNQICVNVERPSPQQHGAFHELCPRVLSGKSSRGLIRPQFVVLRSGIQGLTGAPILQIARYALPFFFLMLFTTAILTLFPQIALFLPQIMIAK